MQLVDPLTGATLVGNKYPTRRPTTHRRWRLQKYLPEDRSDVRHEQLRLRHLLHPLIQNDNQFVTRVDWTISSKTQPLRPVLPRRLPGSGLLFSNQHPDHDAVWQHPAGADVHAGRCLHVLAEHCECGSRHDFCGAANNRGYNTNDINAATLGVNLYQAAPAGLQMTEGKFTIGGGTNSLSHFNDNTLAIDDDVTWVKGRHQFNFGGEWVQNQLNIGNVYESNGTFTFNGRYSGSGPTGRQSAIGDQNLDFLMGTLSAFQQSKQQQNALRGPIPSLYFQDTFHASKQLTLVGGLRWGPNVMPHDYFNRGLEFNMANFLAEQGQHGLSECSRGNPLLRRPGRDEAVHQELVPAVLSERRGFVRSDRKWQDRHSRWRRADVRQPELLHRAAQPAESALRHGDRQRRRHRRRVR